MGYGGGGHGVALHLDGALKDGGAHADRACMRRWGGLYPETVSVNHMGLEIVFVSMSQDFSVCAKSVQKCGYSLVVAEPIDGRVGVVTGLSTCASGVPD
jgi:hypothetical protein